MKKACFYLVNSLLVISSLLLSVSVNSQKLDETAKLIPADGAEGDFFGNSVATNGEIAVVGAWFKNNLAGAAYIFRRDGDEWTEEQKLTASDASDYDFFGNSVNIYEQYVIIGASGAGNIGAAYIFKFDGNNWNELQKLTSSNGVLYDQFGSSVAINDSYAVVGAQNAQTLKGAVYVYERNGNSWVNEEMLTGNLYASSFGCAVDIDEEAIIIGACDNSYAYVFMLDGNVWTMTAELEDVNGSIYDEFGATVAIDGNYAVVGATHHQNGNGATGAAYVYKCQGSNWVEEQKIIAEDGELDDHFGIVSMYGNTIIVGAYHDDDYGLDAGSAYRYQKEGTVWQFKEKLFASDGFAGDEFGSSIAVYSDVIVAGAPDNNDNGSNSGSAYVFNYDPPTSAHFLSEQIIGLEQNYPNPFQHETTITYFIEKLGFVQIDIFNANGFLIKTVASEKVTAGRHSIHWDGKNQDGAPVTPGLYFYRLKLDLEVMYKNMLKI